MKEETITGLGILHEPVQPVENGLFRCPAIGQNPDFFYGKAEILQQHIPDVGYISGRGVASTTQTRCSSQRT
ncbi:MAG: hypothetical protein V2B19_03065 [Pseudomonadota bacterium]